MASKFLFTGSRVTHMDRVLAWHPSFHEKSFGTLHFLLREPVRFIFCAFNLPFGYVLFVRLRVRVYVRLCMCWPSFHKKSFLHTTFPAARTCVCMPCMCVYACLAICVCLCLHNACSSARPSTPSIKNIYVKSVLVFARARMHCICTLSLFSF